MSLFLCLVIPAVAGVFFFVLFSFAFSWYELANSEPDLLVRRFAPSRLAFAAGLLLQESAFLLLNLLLYPLGLLEKGEAHDPAAPGTPVIFLHGLFQNRACWLLVKFRLRREGFGNLFTLNLPPWKDIESLTEKAAKKVDEVRHALGVERVHLVGHSMGGLLIRNYLQLRGGASRVDRCVLLAAPNDGSKLAPFSLSPLGIHAMPGSSFLRRLAAAPLPPEVGMTALCSRHDNIVLPWTSGRLPGAANVELTGLGHAALLYHPRAFGPLVRALKGEEA